MGALPGTQLSLTGASGSTGLLSPKSGWRAYVFNRGGSVAQDSSGTLITFDSADVASRFAVNSWVQVGTDTSKIRKVSAVGGNSISVSGAAVTVTENNRILLLGNTQPSVSGGAATYIIPSSTIYQRDNDASDIYANSMVTSNADGLVQFWGGPAYFDVLIQDGNQSNQGLITDLPVGAIEGVSTLSASVFGATVTINGRLIGQTVTVNAALGVTGWATFGSTVTMNSTLGVTGFAVFGSTITANAAFGSTGWATFGASVTVAGALGVTGAGAFGATLTTTTILGTSDFRCRRVRADQGSTITSTDWLLSSGWGSTASIVVSNGSVDQAGRITITANGATFASNPSATLIFKNGSWGGGRHGTFVCTRVSPDVVDIAAYTSGANATAQTWIFGVTPSANQTYQCSWAFFGTTGGF